MKDAEKGRSRAVPGAAEWESVPNGAAHQQRHRDRKVGEPGTPEQDREFAHAEQK